VFGKIHKKLKGVNGTPNRIEELGTQYLTVPVVKYQRALPDKSTGDVKPYEVGENIC
jgi:hypothetical protein